MKVGQYIWKNSMLKIFNSKMATFLVVLMVISWSYTQPLLRFVRAVDYPVNWCLFPFILCKYSFLILFWFGIIYIHSDVPFMQHVQMYHILRIGRKKWAVGQIGGIICRSVTAVFLTAVCTVLPVITRMEWTNQWGKLLRTAAMTDAAVQYGFEYIFYYEIFAEYTPLELMLLTVLLCSMIAAFIGIFMFLVCLYANWIVAVSGAAAICLLLFAVLNMHPKIRIILARVVPPVWANIARIKTADYGYYWLPSIPYMFGFLTIGITCMTVIILMKVKKVEFNWENDDM